MSIKMFEFAKFSREERSFNNDVETFLKKGEVNVAKVETSHINSYKFITV